MRYSKQEIRKGLIGLLLAWMLTGSVLLPARADSAAGSAVSVFVATDRHASYETVAGGSRSQEEGGEAVLSQSKHRGKLPVYDENGDLLWHNHLTEVLRLVAQDPEAVQPEAFVIGGDHVGEGSPAGMDAGGYPLGAPYFSLRAVDAQIRSVYGDGVLRLYTYGSHDQNETGVYGEGFFSGPREGAGYYLYGISYAQMIYDTDAQALAEDRYGKAYAGKDIDDLRGISARTAARVFLSWVKSLKDHLPIIVMSHVPLHADRGDNLGAWTWLNALNSAAENHPVIFLWGHNHTLEPKSEEKAALEQAHYLVQPGEVMTVQSWVLDGQGKVVAKFGDQTDPEEPETTPRKKKTGEEKEQSLVTRAGTVHFIYMNAGYLINGIGSLLTFSDGNGDGGWDTLTVKRYALEAEDAGTIGSTGPASPWRCELPQWPSQP